MTDEPPTLDRMLRALEQHPQLMRDITNVLFHLSLPRFLGPWMVVHDGLHVRYNVRMAIICGLEKNRQDGCWGYNIRDRPRPDSKNFAAVTEASMGAFLPVGSHSKMTGYRNIDEAREAAEAVLASGGFQFISPDMWKCAFGTQAHEKLSALQNTLTTYSPNT